MEENFIISCDGKDILRPMTLGNHMTKSMPRNLSAIFIKNTQKLYD